MSDTSVYPKLEPTIQREDPSPHRSPEEEITFFYNISMGNTDEVRRYCKQNSFLNMEGAGVLSRDPLTNLKYHFVIATAMITRICHEEGMEMEKAFRLNDYYILQLDEINTPEGMAALHERMVLDYTGKMHMLRYHADLSGPIRTCVDYIYANLPSRITVEDLSGVTGVSPSHLSRLFRKEMGLPISDYIRERKMEAARHLLCYSDFSLAEISSYLSFSSQSHFNQTFRAYEGMTPRQYRTHHYMKLWNINETDASSGSPVTQEPDGNVTQKPNGN